MLDCFLPAPLYPYGRRCPTGLGIIGLIVAIIVAIFILRLAGIL
jgi:hypothetical protein